MLDGLGTRAGLAMRKRQLRVRHQRHKAAIGQTQHMACKLVHRDKPALPVDQQDAFMHQGECGGQHLRCGRHMLAHGTQPIALENSNPHQDEDRQIDQPADLLDGLPRPFKRGQNLLAAQRDRDNQRRARNAPETHDLREAVTKVWSGVNTGLCRPRPVHDRTAEGLTRQQG